MDMIAHHLQKMSALVGGDACAGRLMMVPFVLHLDAGTSIGCPSVSSGTTRDDVDWQTMFGTTAFQKWPFCVGPQAMSASVFVDIMELISGAGKVSHGAKQVQRRLPFRKRHFLPVR